jgi:hypothetical protein
MELRKNMRLASTFRSLVFGLSAITGTLCIAPEVFPAESDCGADAAGIVRKAYPQAMSAGEKSFEADSVTVTLPAEGSLDYQSNSMVCRRWPARPDLLLVAVPLMAKSPEEGFEEGDLELLVMDFDARAIRYR